MDAHIDKVPPLPPTPLLQRAVSYQAQETGTTMMLSKLHHSNSQSQKHQTPAYTESRGFFLALAKLVRYLVSHVVGFFEKETD